MTTFFDHFLNSLIITLLTASCVFFTSHKLLKYVIFAGTIVAGIIVTHVDVFLLTGRISPFCSGLGGLTRLETMPQDEFSLLIFFSICLLSFLASLHTLFGASKRNYFYDASCQAIILLAAFLMFVSRDIISVCLGYTLSSVLFFIFIKQDKQNFRVFKCLLIADICFSVGLLIFSRADFSVNTDFSVLANLLILAGVLFKASLYKFKPITSVMYSNVTINAVFLHMIISISPTILIFRIVPLFCNFANATLALLVISGSSSIYFSLLAVFQKNIRRITDLAALSTISVALFLHTLGFYSVAKAALFVHLFVRTTLILLTENIVKTMSGETNISRMGGLRKITPTLAYMAASIFVLFLFSLSFIDGMISSPVIESLIQTKNVTLLLIYSCFFVMTFVYISRLFMMVFFGKNTSPEQVIAHIKEPLLPLSNLLLVSFFAASYILFFSLDTVLENKGKFTELSLLAVQIKFALLLVCILAAILTGVLVNISRVRQKTRKERRIKAFLFEEINFGFITNISVFVKKYLLVLWRKGLNTTERAEKFLKKTTSYVLNEICFNSENAMLFATILSVFIITSFFILSSPVLIFKS
jgi:hypothetical protein